MEMDKRSATNADWLAARAIGWARIEFSRGAERS